MGKDQGTDGPAITDQEHVEQLTEQIQATREELGDTVEALAAKADVKAQAKKKVEQTTTSIADKKDEMLGKVKEASPEAAISTASGIGRTVRENPVPVAITGAFVLGLAAGWLTKD